MKDVSKIIYRFLEGDDVKGLNIIRNIFYKQISSYMFNSLDWDKEDYFQEFVLKLLNNKNKILEIFHDNTAGLVSYIREMIKNFLKDKLIESRKYHHENIEDYEYRLESNMKKPSDVLVFLEAFHIKENIVKYLNEQDLILLCYLTCQECQEFIEKTFFNNVSKDAMYKRVERLKMKIREFIKSFGFDEDSFGYFLSNMLYEICNTYKGG